MSRVRLLVGSQLRVVGLPLLAARRPIPDLILDWRDIIEQSLKRVINAL